MNTNYKLRNHLLLNSLITLICSELEKYKEIIH